MEIQLNQVCPNVFEGIKINSEVWNSNLLIENEGRYQILAQSGRGKTSFLYFLLGLRNDYTGEIQINQKRIQDIKEEEWVKLRKTKMTSIFQDLQLIGHLTVAENIRLIPEYAKGYDEDAIQKIVTDLGIEEKWNEKVNTLSFGQKQRVAIIRSICKPFEILLCDEPFSHLDTENTRLCQSLILKRLDEEKASLLITTLDGESEMALKTINL